MTSLYKLEQDHVHNGVLKIAGEIMEERSKFSANLNDGGFDDEYGSKPKNFINALTNPRNGLDQSEILDEINTFIGAARKLKILNEF